MNWKLVIVGVVLVAVGNAVSWYTAEAMSMFGNVVATVGLAATIGGFVKDN